MVVAASGWVSYSSNTVSSWDTGSLQIQTENKGACQDRLILNRKHDFFHFMRKSLGTPAVADAVNDF